MLRHLTVGLWLVGLCCLAKAEREAPVPAPEIFEAFAAGWLNYSDGHYAEAMRGFHRAYQMDARFQPAIGGIISCADEMGFTQAGDALVCLENKNLIYRSEYGQFSQAPQPGIAFWGVYFDDAPVDGIDVVELEAILGAEMANMLGVPFQMIRPLEHVRSEEETPANFQYHILATLSSDEEGVHLDLHLIEQLQIETAERQGVTAQRPIGQFQYREGDVSTAQGDLMRYFREPSGREFLADFLEGAHELTRTAFTPATSLDQALEEDADVFDLFRIMAETGPRYDLFLQASNDELSIRQVGHVRNSLFNGLGQWMLDTMPRGSGEDSLVELLLILRTKDCGYVPYMDGFSKDECLQALATRYPQTPGGQFARLHLLYRELNTDTINTGVGDEIEAILVQLDKAPLVQLTSVLAYEGRFHRLATRKNLLSSFRTFRAAAKGDATEPARPLPSFLMAYHRNGVVRLGGIASSPKSKLSYNDSALSQAEVSQMLRMHADNLRGEIDDDELFAAMADEARPTAYLTELGLQQARNGGANWGSEDKALLAERMALLGERIVFDWNNLDTLGRWKFRRLNLLTVDYLNQLKKLELEGEPRLTRIGKQLNQQRVDVLLMNESTAEVRNNLRALSEVLNELAELNPAQQQRFDETIAQAIDKYWQPEPAGSWHGPYWYLDWLARNGKEDELRRILTQYDLHLRQIMITKPGLGVNYNHMLLAQKNALYWLTFDDLDRARIWLDPYLTWELEPEGLLRDRDAPDHLAAGCARLAMLAWLQGDGEIAIAAADRALALTDGKQINASIPNEVFDTHFADWVLPDQTVASIALAVRQRYATNPKISEDFSE